MKAVRAGRATLLGVVGHEHRAFIADAIDVGRFADRQAAVINARLHPADVVTHDEKNVGFRLLGSCRSNDPNVARPMVRTVAKAVATPVWWRFVRRLLSFS